MPGFRVKYVLATKRVNELVEAADDKQPAKPLPDTARVDLLCIDELGYMELDKRGAELLFQVPPAGAERIVLAISKHSWTPGFVAAVNESRDKSRQNFWRPVPAVAELVNVALPAGPEGSAE